MKIQLYNSNAPSNQLDKSSFLTLVTELEGSLRSPCSVLSPKIVVKYNGYLNINYMYIEEFGRYYFVNDVVSLRNNLWVVSGEVDVLMSYKDKLLEHSAIVYRTNKYPSNQFKYIDNYMPLSSIKYDNTVSFPELSNFIKPSNDNFSIFITVTGAGGVTLESNKKDVSTSYGITTPSTQYSPSGKTNITYVFDNEENFYEFVNNVYKDNSLVSQIISIYILPIKVPNDNKIPVDYINLGEKSIACTASFIYTDLLLSFEGEFLYPNRQANFYDYEPFSTYDIYIPYYGWLNIEYRYLLSTVYVKYFIDFTNGECQIIFSDGNNIIKTTNFTLGQQLVISSSGVAEANRKSESYYLRYQAQLDYLSFTTAANVVSSITGGVGNMISAKLGLDAQADNAFDNYQPLNSSGNPNAPITLNQSYGSIAAAGLNMLGSIVSSGLNYAGQSALYKGNYEANMVLNVAYGVPNSVSSSFNNYSLFGDFRIRKIYTPPSITNENLALYKGRIVNERINLSLCRGYTVLSDIILNIPNITTTEYGVLLQLLYSGVRFPDSSSN